MGLKVLINGKGTVIEQLPEAGAKISNHQQVILKLVKKLQDILYGVAIEYCGSTAIEVESIEFDSRKVKKEALFIAQKGVVTDGHEFISSALINGAVAIICEQLPEECKKGLFML